jgi:hypothetical protein
MQKILDLIDKAGGVTSLAKKFGISEDQVKSAASSVLPKLGDQLKSKLGSIDALSGLVGALGGGDHKKYVDEPDKATDDDAVQDGNRILGHVLGSKDESRRVAAEAAAETGLEEKVLKQMLPSFANMTMGSLRKQADEAAPEGKELPDLIAEDADETTDATTDFAAMMRKFID